jgi:hypothetical protein
MGKIGRFACIFTPMALTIASLLCLALVFTGQLSKSNETSRSLYFFKADTSEFNAHPGENLKDVPGTDIDNKLVDLLKTASTSKDLKDFYTVGLWNYCEGTKDEKSGKETITYCSARKAHFWFNPIEVWGLENANGSAADVFGDELQKGLDTYHKFAGWMFWAFLIAIILTAAEFVVGIFAIFSRWGSLVTTIVSTAQTIFVIAAAGSSTAIYATLTASFNSVLKPMNVDASVGTKMLSVVWLAVAFSIASGFFWLVSVCCCSGKSPHKKVVVEKTPYTYERVASPYLGASANSGHAMQPVHTSPSGHGTSGNVYEPFRGQHV